MNPVDWAQIISAIATTVAAGAAAYTTRLALKQQRFQFSPHLQIAGESFQVRMCQESFKRVFWEEPTKEASYLNGGTVDYRFRLTNTGSGSAQDIRIFAQFDLESAYQDVSRKLARCAPGIEILQEEWGAGVFVDGKHIGGFKNPDQAFGFIDYIRPCREDRVEEFFLIDPTLSFFSLVYGYYIMWELMNSNMRLPEQVIYVDFIVKFTDSGGQECEQRHARQLVISGGRCNSDMSDGVIVVSLRSR
ncbi:hypothetical protein [Azorhizobium sp. AG788]|uniref:hypothetical protein n=1 Tax=Azorhizobium sp. AG788 TaxID=2183897 RepID=UPI003138C657